MPLQMYILFRLRHYIKEAVMQLNANNLLEIKKVKATLIHNFKTLTLTVPVTTIDALRHFETG